VAQWITQMTADQKQALSRDLVEMRALGTQASEDRVWGQWRQLPKPQDWSVFGLLQGPVWSWSVWSEGLGEMRLEDQGPPSPVRIAVLPLSEIHPPPPRKGFKHKGRGAVI
jgi:hypothetical protein